MHTLHPDTHPEQASVKATVVPERLQKARTRAQASSTNSETSSSARDNALLGVAAVIVHTSDSDSDSPVYTLLSVAEPSAVTRVSVAVDCRSAEEVYTPQGSSMPVVVVDVGTRWTMTKASTEGALTEHAMV